MKEDPKEEPRPGRVTDTRVQVRDANRMSVFVDGAFSFGMPLEAALELGIAKGLALDRDLLQRCLQADARYRARQRALTLLAHRPRSSSELRDRLVRAGFADDAVDDALSRMAELGYLDDGAFAEAFARDRLVGRRLGPRRAIAELRRKGIDGRRAEGVVSEIAREVDLSEAARTHAEKRLARIAPDEPIRKVRQRLYAYLARRGFRPETIRTVLDQVLAGRR